MARVSVCIPVYNGASFIEEAVQSVLNQSETDLEIIIVDDHSTDHTWDSVTSFRDTRIRLFRNAQRKGLVGNWNTALSYARSPYVTVFHQDDVMHPKSISRKVDILDAHTGVGMVFSDVHCIDDSRQNVSSCFHVPCTTGVVEGSHLATQLCSQSNFICCPSVMVRRSVFAEMGLFDHHFLYAADLEMWMRVCSRYDAYYIDAPLIDYRWHATNETHRFAGKKIELLELERALLSNISLFPESIQHELRELVRHFLVRESLKRVEKHFYNKEVRQALSYGSFFMRPPYTAVCKCVGQSVKKRFFVTK